MNPSTVRNGGNQKKQVIIHSEDKMNSLSSGYIGSLLSKKNQEKRSQQEAVTASALFCKKPMFSWANLHLSKSEVTLLEGLISRVKTDRVPIQLEIQVLLSLSKFKTCIYGIVNT